MLILSNGSENSQNDWFGSIFAEAITEDLQILSGINVLDQSEAFLKQIELGINEIKSEEDHLKVGKALSADKIVADHIRYRGTK